MEKNYEELYMEVVLFSTEDVINDSNGDIPRDDPDIGEWLP